MRRFLLVAGLLAACSRDTPTAPILTHMGLWQLAAVQNESLPYVLLRRADGCGVTVEGASVVFRGNGTFDLTVRYGPRGCESEWVASGMYRFADDSVLTLEASAAPIEMIYRGTGVKWLRQGVPYSFLKQE